MDDVDQDDVETSFYREEVMPTIDRIRSVRDNDSGIITHVNIGAFNCRLSFFDYFG